MREIVCVGPAAWVEPQLLAAVERLTALASRLGLTATGNRPRIRSFFRRRQARH